MAVVSPAGLADLPRIAAVSWAAFENSLIQQRIFRDVSKEAHGAQTVARLQRALDNNRQAVYKAVVDDEIVAFALWELPHPDEEPTESPEEAQKKEEKRYPAGTNLELARDLFGQLDLGIKEPHYHLQLLGTDPRFQRTGAGSALLRWGCKRADDDGVDVYLESSAVGIPLYRRAQFEIFGEPIKAKADPDLVLWPMRRPALTFHPVNLVDLPYLAPLHNRAFGPTAVMQYAFSDVTPEAGESFFIQRFGVFIHKRDQEGERIMLTCAKRGERYVGLAFSHYEPEAKDRTNSGEKRFWPEGANVERALEYLAGTLDDHKKKVPFAHWSLNILSVLPEDQGSGIGRRLVEQLFQIAKRDVGRPLYERMGFKHFADILVAKEDKEVKLWPMIYEHPQE
ncbi:hypothetical protein Rhopal_006713-T1 [Rhodotorula paludigena]|uniref:N-acetyltransferase domain-containing protein n=1 Tax=Rhodotorula paludigena TaxID=86838 RepID=A0AAV5GVY4_9BASI|nr:hypothetical protein Rhopal_006713-T1 [Rhodotorula paludigena]